MKTSRYFLSVCAAGAAVFGILGAAVPPSYAQNLKQTNFNDGTGSIGLAPGWQLDGVYRGAVQCVGPNGAAVVLKMPWVIMRPESSLNNLSAAQTTPTARAGDIAGALREIMQKKIGATLKNVRGKKAPSAPGGPPAYLLMYEYVQNGQPMTGLGYFAVLDYGPSQPFWQLYSSAIVAPTKSFTQAAPTMVKIWRSWKPNGLPPHEGSSSAIFDDILQDRQLRYEKIQNEAGKLL